jgi:hypothetical protein
MAIVAEELIGALCQVRVALWQMNGIARNISMWFDSVQHGTLGGCATETATLKIAAPATAPRNPKPTTVRRV